MPLRPAATLWPPVLLGSQFVFNIGFYAVVPFLAIFLRDDMLLSGGLIGLILGLRTFSQQGMFIVGGALSDRFGAKVIILSGCIVRVSGYLLLAFGDVRFLPTAVWLRICKRPFRRQRYWAVPRPAKLLLTASTMAPAR